MKRVLRLFSLIVVIFVVSASEYRTSPGNSYRYLYSPIPTYQSRPHGGTSSEYQNFQLEERERMRQSRNQNEENSWQGGQHEFNIDHRNNNYRQEDPRDYARLYKAYRARRKRPEHEYNRHRILSSFQSDNNYNGPRIRNRNPNSKSRYKSSRNKQNRNNNYRYPNPYYHQASSLERKDEYEDLSTTTEIITSTTTLEPFDVNDIKVPTAFLRIEYMISFSFLGLMYGLGFLVLFQSLCVPVAKFVTMVVYWVLAKANLVKRYTIQDVLEQIPPQ